jgi:hypothetical protein
MNNLVESHIVVDWARKAQFSNKPYYEIVNKYINSYFDLSRKIKKEPKYVFMY